VIALINNAGIFICLPPCKTVTGIKPRTEPSRVWFVLSLTLKRTRISGVGYGGRTYSTLSDRVITNPALRQAERNHQEGEGDCSPVTSLLPRQRDTRAAERHGSIVVVDRREGDLDEAARAAGAKADTRCAARVGLGEDATAPGAAKVE
jgi:hypothetical protein